MGKMPYYPPRVGSHSRPPLRIEVLAYKFCFRHPVPHHNHLVEEEVEHVP
jgi:hypothetical protein